MTSTGNAAPLVCVAVLILALAVPPAAQQGGGCPACDCPQSTVTVGVLVGSCVAVLVGTLIFEALAILCYRKYCKDRDKPQKVAHRFMISPDEELVVKENLGYESDSDVQERSLRAAKEQKRASIFTISETKDNIMYVPALYRNPISKDHDMGNAIMNGHHDYEPDFNMDNIYTYNAGWGSRVPNILSGKAHADSLEDLYIDGDEYPILHTLQGGVGPVNFASSKYRDAFGRQSIDVHEDDGEVTTYTYTTGFGGKVRREVATVTSEKADDIEIVGDRVTWRKSSVPQDVVLDMGEEEAKPETRITIDDNFAIGKPTSTRRQDRTGADIHSESQPGTSFDPSGNFILRATPSTSRSDSSDDDLYDYGESTERQQQTVNMHKHSLPGKIGHGTFRATVGGIPLDRRAPEDETPTELFNSRYRYSTGLNKAKLLAMRAAAAVHAREGIVDEGEEPQPEEQGDQPPVFGYIKLVQPDYDPNDGQQYRVLPRRDADNPNAVRMYPVDSTGEPITLGNLEQGGFARDSYLRHRRETYVEVADTGVQCDISTHSDSTTSIPSGGTEERASILRKNRTSYRHDMDPMDDIPTIGVIRLLSTKSSKHVRIREDHVDEDFETLSFFEEDEPIPGSLQDLSYRSSRTTERNTTRERRARSAPVRSERAPITEQGSDYDMDSVPTIGIIRLVRPDSTSDTSGVESEIASSDELSPDDSRPGRKSDKWTQHEIPILRLAQQILQESVQDRTSSQQSLHRLNQSMDDIPTIGVVRLMRPRSTTRGSTKQIYSTDEQHERSEDITRRHTISRDSPVSEMPTIGVIKLLKQDSRQKTAPKTSVTVDKATQPENSWAQLLREMQTMVENEIISKTTRTRHDQPQSATEGLARTINVIKLEEVASHMSDVSVGRPVPSEEIETRDEGTMPAFSWSHLIREVEDKIERRYMRMSAPAPKDDFDITRPVQKLAVIQLKAAPERIIRDSITQTSVPSTSEKGVAPAWSFNQIREEIEEEAVNRFKKTLRQLDRKQPQEPYAPVSSVSVIRLKNEPQQEIMIRDSVSQTGLPNTYEKSTGPAWSFNEIREEIEEDAVNAFKKTLRQLSEKREPQQPYAPVSSVSIIRLKNEPQQEIMIRDSVSQTGLPNTYEKSTGPAWSFNEIREEIEEDAVNAFKKTLRQLSEKREPQQPYAPVSSVSIIRLKNEPQQEIMIRDSVSQTSLPNTYEKSTGPAWSFNEIKDDIEEEAISKFKRTLSQLDRPAEVQGIQQPVRTVSVIKLKKEPEPAKPTQTSRGVQPYLPWREMKEEIEDEAIEAYKKQMRRLQPKEAVEKVTDSAAPVVSIIKLKGPEVKPEPAKWDSITQCDLSQRKPSMADQVTEPVRPWADVLHNVRRILENEYRRTISELETRLTSMPKDEPETTNPTFAVIKLKGPDVKPEPEKPAMVDEKSQVAPHTSEQESTPERPWPSVLQDVRQILENEYRRTIRELEDQLSGTDEPDVGKTMAVIKLNAPHVPMVETINMSTQIDTPDTGEQGTGPDRSWSSLMQDVRSSVENEYRVIIRELESELAERPKNEPKGPTRLGIFKLKGPKQAKTKRLVVHDSFTQSEIRQNANKATQPSKSWLSLVGEIEEDIERRLSRKTVQPLEVEPEILQQSQQIVEMAPPQFRPTTADVTTQSSEPQTKSLASQSVSVKGVSKSVEAKIGPDVTDQSTSCDLKPQVSSQETQAHPSTEDLEILTDRVPLSEFGTQVNLQQIPEIITPTLMQPVHAPITFKETDTEKIDFAVQVIPDTVNRSSATEKRDSADRVVQVGIPEPSHAEFGVQVKPQTNEGQCSVVTETKDVGTHAILPLSSSKSSGMTNVELLDSAIQVKPEVKNRVCATDKKSCSDAFSQADLPVEEATESMDTSVQAAPSINVQFTSTDTVTRKDAFTQLKPHLVEHGDKFIQVGAELAEAETATPVVNLMDVAVGKELLTNAVATEPRIPAKHDASVQVSSKVETEPAIIKAVVQGEQFAMPSMPTPVEATDSATQTMQQTVEFSNQFEPETRDKFTVKSLDGSDVALQVSQNSTESSTETVRVGHKTIPVQVRPRTVDKATECEESKSDGVDVGIQYSITIEEIGISAEPETTEGGTIMEIKAQLDVGTQAECEITVEPAIIRDVMRAPEESLMNLEVSTSDAITQTSSEETKHEGTATLITESTDAAVQHVVTRSTVDVIIQVEPDLSSSGTLAFTRDHMAQGSQVKPQTVDRGMTTVIRGSSERSSLANLLPKVHKKPASKDAFVQIQPVLNQRTQGTLTDKTEFNTTTVQVSPETSTRGHTSKPDVREQWSMTEKSPEKRVLEFIIPQVEKPVQAARPILKAELVDKTTQVITTGSKDTSSGTEIVQIQAATQSDVESQPELTDSSIQIEVQMVETMSQTTTVQRRSVGLSGDVPECKTSFTQYEPTQVGSDASNQTTIPTRSTGFSPQKVVFKSTGLSPEKMDVKTSSTQYHTAATQSNGMQTEEPIVLQEEVVFIEKSQTLESVPRSPTVELINAETQAEPVVMEQAEVSSQTEREVLPSTKDMGSHPIQLQMKESHAQYEPERFRNAASSQTKVLTQDMGVSPKKAEVKASFTQYQMISTQDNIMQTEPEHQPIEESITVEKIPTVEYMPVLPQAELVDAETQAEPRTTDRAILTQPERREKTTSTAVKTFTHGYVQNVPRMTSFGQQMTTERPLSSSQGTTMAKIEFSSKPTQVKPSVSSFGQMMEPKVDDHWSMTGEEPAEEMITSKEEIQTLQSVPQFLAVEMINAETQADVIAIKQYDSSSQTEREVLPSTHDMWSQHQTNMSNSVVQTIHVNVESKSMSTTGPQMKESHVQYEPELFRKAFSSQTEVPMQTKGSSTPVKALKTTGVSSERTEVKAAFTQYQTITTHENYMQTEQEPLPIEERITVEEVPTVEYMPAFPSKAELVDAETQAEPKTTDRAILTQPERREKTTSTAVKTFTHGYVQNVPRMTSFGQQMTTERPLSSSQGTTMAKIEFSSKPTQVKPSVSSFGQMMEPKVDDHWSMTDEEPAEEMITSKEEIQTLQSVPQFLAVEMIHAETQAEPRTTDRAILTQPERQEKTTSTAVKTFTHGYVQNVPRMTSFGQQMTTERPFSSSQGTTMAKIEFSSKQTQVKPSVSSFGQMMEPNVDDHWSMTDEEPAEEMITSKEEIQTLQSVPQFLAVEMIHAETQAEPKTTDRAILTQPERREKMTSTAVKTFTHGYVQNVPRMTSFGQQMTTERPLSSSQGTTMAKIEFSSKPTQVKPSVSSFGQMMEPKVDDHWSMTDEEPTEEMIIPKEEIVVQSLPPVFKIQTMDAGVQVEPTTSSIAIDTLPVVRSKTREVPTQMSVKHETAGAQATVRHSSMSSQTPKEEKIAMKSFGVQTQRYLVTSSSYVQLKDKTYKSVDHMGDLVGIKARESPRTENKQLQAAAPVVNTTSQSVNPDLTTTGFQTDKVVAVTDMEVQTNPVTIIDFVPVLVDSTVQYETRYYYSESVQADVPTTHQYVSAVPSNKTQGTTTPVTRVQPSSSQTESHLCEESFSQTDAVPEPEPFITPVKIEPVQFAPPPMLPDTQVAESQTEPIMSTDQSTSVRQPTLLDSHVQVRPRMQDTNTMTPVKQYLAKSVQEEPLMLSKMMQVVTANKEESTWTELNPTVDNTSQTDLYTEPEPSISPMTLQPVHHAALTMPPEMLVAESQTDGIHSVSQGTSMQVPKLQSSHVQVSLRMRDTNTMTAVKQYVPHTTQAKPDVREDSTWTEPNEIVDSTSQTDPLPLPEPEPLIAPITLQPVQFSAPVLPPEMLVAESQTDGIHSVNQGTSMQAPKLHSSHTQVSLRMRDINTMTATKHYVHKAVQEEPSVQSQTMQANPDVREDSTWTEPNEIVDSGSQTDPLPEPEPLIAPITLEPVQFSAPYPEMLVAESQTDGIHSVSQGTSMQAPKLQSSHVQVSLTMHDTNTMTAVKQYVPHTTQTKPEVREDSTWTEPNEIVDSTSQTDPLPLPEPEPLIAPITLQPVQFSAPVLPPEMMTAESQTDGIHSVNQGTSMQAPKLHSSHVQVSLRMRDINTMTATKHYVPKAVQEEPSVQSQTMQAKPDVREGSTWTEPNQIVDSTSQTDPLPEPEPLIAPITLEPVQFSAPYPEMLVAESQTDGIHSVSQGTSMQVPKLQSSHVQVSLRMRDTNTMTAVKQYVPHTTQANPDVREDSTWTEPNEIVDSTSQTDPLPLPEPEPLIAPITLQPVQFSAPVLPPEMLVAESQTDGIHSVNQGTSMQAPKLHSSHVQVSLRMHDINTMTATKHYVPKAVQEEPSVQSQTMQAKPDVREDSTWTEPNEIVDSTSQTNPLPEPEPLIAPITLEPVQFSAPYPEMLVAESQTDGIHSVSQGTSMQVPKLQSSHVQVSLRMRDTNTMTEVKQYVPHTTQANPDVREDSTWTEPNEIVDSTSQTDPLPLPEPEPLIAPITLQPVQFSAPVLPPEMLVAESQTDGIHSVNQGTSMQVPKLQSSHVQVSIRMRDTNTMTPVKQYVPHTTQANPDVREDSTWTEPNQIVDSTSQTDPLPEPEPLIAPITFEPVQFSSPNLLPEMLVAESQTEDIQSVKLIEKETQYKIDAENFESQTSTETKDHASCIDVDTQESVCQTELSLEDLEEMLATLKQKLEEKPVVQEMIIPQQLNPVHAPMTLPACTEDLGIQTFLETVQRSTSPILQEMKQAITQYEADLKELGVQVKPDVLDQEIDALMTNVQNAAIQYVALSSEDKPTQFSPVVKDTGSLTDQKTYQHNYTNTKSVSLESKTMQVSPYSMDKWTAPLLPQYDMRSTQTSAVDTTSRWTQDLTEWSDAPIQVRPILEDATSQTDIILKEEPLFNPVVRKEVRLEMRSYKETNTMEVQTDPVIIKSAGSDDENESLLDSGIDTDVQTDPVVFLSDVESEIEVMDEDCQTYQVDMIDADIQVESKKDMKGTTSQTTSWPQIPKTVQTEPKQVVCIGTETMTPMIQPISSQTVPIKTETRGFQYEPVPYLTSEDMDTQTSEMLRKEQGTFALDSQTDSSTTQTDDLQVIEPEVIHVASIAPVETPLQFSAPAAEVNDAGVQASTDVTDEDSQTTKVHTTDRPSSPGISYSVAESQTTSPLRSTKNTQYEQNTAPRKTQTDRMLTVNMGIVTDQVISQDSCLQTFLETKPEIVDRSMQHATIVRTGYSQTEKAEHQHEETQTDEIEEEFEEEIEYIDEPSEVLDTFTQTTNQSINMESQTEGMQIVQSGTDAPVTDVKDVGLQVQPVTKLQAGATQTPRRNTKNESTVMEPTQSASMSVQTDIIPVRIVDEQISPLYVPPVHAPLSLPDFKPDVQDTSVQTDVKTDERGMQHDNEPTQFNFFSTRVVKGEVTPTPTVVSEFSMRPQETHFFSQLETAAYPQEEKLTYKHLEHKPTQAQPKMEDALVQVQPDQDERATATNELTYTSIEVQTESPNEPMEEIIRVSQVPVQHTPYLQLGPILLDTGTQVKPRTSDHGMSTSMPIYEPSYLEIGPMLLDSGTQARPQTSEHGMSTIMPSEEPSYIELGPMMLDSGTQARPKTSEHGMSTLLPLEESYLELGPMLLDTGTQARPRTSEHAMSTLMPLEPLPAWTQTEIPTEASVSVRQESSQATMESKDAGVQVKMEKEVGMMTAGIQTVVIYEEKPLMIDTSMQVKPLHTDQATLTSKVPTISSSSNTEPVNMKQAMAQVSIKPQTEARATLTMPKYSRNITTQAMTISYDACVQHDDLPDMADKGLQIKPVMVDDSSESIQLRHVDRMSQVEIDIMKPVTSDAAVQYTPEMDTTNKILQIKPASMEAGVSTEIETKDKAIQVELLPEIDEFIRPDVTEIQHAPISFPDLETADSSVQHEPSYDVQTVQTSIDTTERASSPVGPDNCDGSSQTKTETSDVALQTYFPEPSATEVQEMSYFSEDYLQLESVEEDSVTVQHTTEEQSIAPMPTVLRQDAQVQYNPITEDLTTETVSTGIDFSNQSQPLTINQGTSTEITKHSQAEVQVDIDSRSVKTQEASVQHETMFRPVDAIIQVNPLTVEEGTSTVPLKRTEASVQYIAPKDQMPPSPKIIHKTSEKGTSVQYVTAQSSTQTILMKSDVSIQSRPNTKSKLTHVAIKPDSQDQSTDTRPNVRAFETQTFFPKKSTGVQCDHSPLVHNESQYERMFVEDNSVQVEPVIREQANSPIFKRKDVGNASCQTEVLQEELDSSVDDLIRSAPSMPFRRSPDSEFMHDYSDRLNEYIDRDEQMPDITEHPVERIQTSTQFEPRQESSSPVWDYAGDFSSCLYDTEMTESSDIIERLLISSQGPLNLEEPIQKDETDWVMSEPTFYTDSAVQTSVMDTKNRSTSPLFPSTRDAQSQFGTELVYSDTNIQVSPTIASESTYTTPVSCQDAASQADFAVETVLTSEEASQHYILGQDMSAQVEPLMVDAGMTFTVECTPTSTQAIPETSEQGTSTLKQPHPTSDRQTQAKPDVVAQTTSPLAIRKNQMSVQVNVDQRHTTTQYDRIGSSDKVVQMSPQSSEKGTSTKPDYRDISIQVIPTQRHETTQYERNVKTVDFMVQYRAQHLDISTQSVDVKNPCEDRASSPIHMELPVVHDTESLIQPETVQQVSSAPQHSQPFEPFDDTALRQELREEIRTEVTNEIREVVREEIYHEVQHEINSRIEAEVRDSLRQELHITVREELREEYIEEYKEELLIEIKEELKIDFESRLRLEFEDRTREDLEFHIRREMEPKVRRDLEPIIRREIEQEYVKEVIHEVRTEAPVMYQPTEYKPEPIKPLMLDRGTSPAVRNVHEVRVQASTETRDGSCQYDIPRMVLDGITQTHVYQAEHGTSTEKARRLNVHVQVEPKLKHQGTSPSTTPNRESGVQAVVQSADKAGQFEVKPNQSDVAIQFSREPQTAWATSQVQPDTEEQGTVMEAVTIHPTYVQTENPLQMSENTQTLTDQIDAFCQSEPVICRDTSMQVQPVSFDKSTSTLPQPMEELSTQVEFLEGDKPEDKIPVKQQDSSVQYESITEVTDRRIQARPVVREQANSPLLFLPFDMISPQSQDPSNQSVRARDAQKEYPYVEEIITGERVLPVESAPPRFPSPLPETSSFRQPTNLADWQVDSPTLKPQLARLDYVPMVPTPDLDTYKPNISQSSYESSFVSKYESSNTLTKDVLKSMPPRCEMILLQTTVAGTTYTSAFRTSTPTSYSPSYPTYPSHTSILEPGKPSVVSPEEASPIFSDTDSDSLPDMTELEKIRRDLSLSKVIVTDDQATLVGYLVNRHDAPRTPDLPATSPFSSPSYIRTDGSPSRYDYRSRSTFSKTPQSPRKGHQHFMNLEHTPTETIPDVTMEDPFNDFTSITEPGDWFKRETSAYRLNVPYDKKGSPFSGARIVHSVSPSHTPGHMSPVYFSSDHGTSTELMPIPRGMVTRLSDLLSEGLPSDDESEFSMSRLSEMIEKHRELSQPPKWSPRGSFPTFKTKDEDSEVDTTDSETDTESFTAVMDFTDPFLHEDPNFWRRGQTDFSSASTNSDVSSDDDTVTVYGDCDVYSFDLPTLKPFKSSKSPRDDSFMPGEPPRKRHTVIKIDRHRIREELSMSEVVQPEGPPRLTRYRMNIDNDSWQKDGYNNRLSKSEPDLYKATTADVPMTTPPSYSRAYPYTTLGQGRKHPAPEQLMVDAGSIPALSTEIRYAKLVQKETVSHSQWSQYGRLSRSDPDLASWDELFDVGHF